MGKRKYTTSAATTAQRRKAAWKHGQNAATALTQTVHPCRRDLCPLNRVNADGTSLCEGSEPTTSAPGATEGFDRCETRRVVEGSGKQLEACVVELAINPDVRRRYLEALDGNPDGLREQTATFFAAMANLTERELAELQREGGVISFPIFSKDGDEVGSGTKVNPRVEPLQKFLEMLGMTAAQQAITPKSAGEKNRDDGIGATLDFYTRRAALAGPPMKVVKGEAEP